MYNNRQKLSTPAVNYCRPIFNFCRRPCICLLFYKYINNTRMNSTYAPDTQHHHHHHHYHRQPSGVNCRDEDCVFMDAPVFPFRCWCCCCCYFSWPPLRSYILIFHFKILLLLVFYDFRVCAPPVHVSRLIAGCVEKRRVFFIVHQLRKNYIHFF